MTKLKDCAVYTGIEKYRPAQMLISNKKEYFQGIDGLKGWLIIFVIVGHLLIPLGKESESFPRYIIYSFHIPLFLAISGFLLRKESLIAKSFFSLANKYFSRLIIPWGIAYIFYFVPIIIIHFFPATESMIHGTDSLKVIPAAIIFLPAPHLWYVPTLLLMILLLWSALGKEIPTRTILGGAFLVSLVMVNFVPLLHLKGINNLMNCYYPFYLIFFVLGFYLRNFYDRKTLTNKVLVLPIMVGLILYRIYHFGYSTNQNFYSLDFFFLNIVLIFSLLIWLADRKVAPFLVEWIGRYSLPIYLWHMWYIYLELYFTRNILKNDNLLLFVFLATPALIFSTLIPGIAFVAKNRLMSKLILGNRPQRDR